MKKPACVLALVFMCFASYAEIASYAELVSTISDALQDKEILCGVSFTNEIKAFACSATNELHCVTAQLGLALAFHEIASSSGDDGLYMNGLAVVTNMLQSQSCPMTSWQRYAGMSILCDYLNDDAEYSRSFEVSTNAIALIDSYAPILENPNFWSSLSQYDCIPGASLRESFQVNAAASCVMLGHSDIAVAFTNGLPSNIMAPLLELMDAIGN